MLALEAERAGLLRDVRLREEMEQQYAKRGTLQVGAGWKLRRLAAAAWPSGLAAPRKLCLAGTPPLSHPAAPALSAPTGPGDPFCPHQDLHSGEGPGPDGLRL